MIKKLVIIDELLLPNSEKRVVVYDGYYLNQNTDPASYENIVCFDKNNSVLWKVNGNPEYWDNDKDTYSGVALTDSHELLGLAFSGNNYRINLETGEATWVAFTK